MIQPGELVALVGDFSPECVAVLLSLIENENIIIPLNNSSKLDYSEKYCISQAEKAIFIDESDVSTFKDFGVKANHSFYTVLRSKKVAGLVLFTSGTSGIPKGAVHNFPKLLENSKLQGEH